MAKPDRRIDAQIDKWLTKLLDQSRRNRLLYFRPSKRGTLQLTSPSPSMIFRNICVEETPQSFWVPDTALIDPSSDDEPEADLPKNQAREFGLVCTSDQPANSLATAESRRKELATTLRRLAAKAKLDLEDRGVRILHVAFGVVEWQEKETNEAVRSPLVMVPVELSRASRQKPWELSPCDEDIVLNPVLAVKLQHDFGVTLPDVPEDWDEYPLEQYLDSVRRCLGRPEWSVADECWLGLFSFHKLPMYRDLDQNRSRLHSHPMIVRLAGASTDAGEPLEITCEPEELDRHIAPQDSFLVVNADSSQLAAIETVKMGTDLVLHGPPGTGKSQTITNVVAEMLAAGKSVLFVSEKMAALDVVFQRIEQAGLGHLCLELHSHKASRRTVVERLHHAMKHDLVARGGMSDTDLARLAQRREQLNQYVLALHENRSPLERTMYDVLGELASLKSAPVRRADASWVTRMSPADYDWAVRLAARLTAVWRIALQGTDFPWYGYVGPVEGTSDLNSLLRPPMDALMAVQASASAAAAAMGLPSPTSLREARLMVRFSELCMRHVPTLDSWLVAGNGHLVVSLLRKSQAGHDQASQHRNAILARQGARFAEGAHTDHSRALDEVHAVLSQRLGLPWDEDTLAVDIMRAGEWLCGLRPILVEIKKLASQIADALGLREQRLSLQRAWDYVELGGMCLSNARPLPQWLSPQGIADAPAQVAGIKTQVEAWKQAQDELLEVFTPDVFTLDLAGMLVRYRDEYGGAFTALRSSYRRDARLLQACANRKLTKPMALALLQKSGEMRTAMERADAGGSVLLAGHYRGLETDWAMIDDALGRAREAMRRLRVSVVPDQFAAVMCRGEGDLDAVSAATSALREAVEGMARDAGEAKLGALRRLQCDGREDFIQTDLEVLLKWLSEVEARVSGPLGVVKGVYEIGDATSLQSVSALKADIGTAEGLRQLEASLEETDCELGDLCGDWFDPLDPDWDRLAASAQWAADATDLLREFRIDIPADFGSRACSDAPWELAPAEQPAALTRATQQAEAALQDLDRCFEHDRWMTGQTGLIEAPFTDAIARLQTLAATAGDVDDWLDLCRAKESMREIGLPEFAGSLSSDPPPTEDLVACFHASLLRTWITATFTSDARLRDFRVEDHERIMSEFRNLDRNHCNTGAARVINRTQARRTASGYVPTGSERAKLVREHHKQRRHLPIRRLFGEIPHLLVELKPCLLMSPLSVGQYLSPDTVFDLVVFDEASQICTEDAAGAIYRGRQVLICGDQKQLPPTDFFQKTIEEDDDQTAEEEVEIDSFQSVLDECLANRLAESWLRWHYRSKHESLIAFSNDRFYSNNLVTFPAAQHTDERLGVHLVHVPDGVYDRGGKRTNEAEAEKVVEIVVDHLRRFPNKTLGVVSFSLSQTQAIEDKLEEWASMDASVDAAVARGRQEGFFVKNLENVQGDERDVMIFSIGYGRDRTGRLSMNFGPLNQSGGERRLNVAITRAKEKIVLVTSIKAGEIDPAQTSSAGVRHLHAYLDFAERGIVALSEGRGSGGEHESPLERDVADAIRTMGYEVDAQVGCSGFRIDLGVKAPAMPGRYILGVECDGATYHSSYTARDRDRLRQEVLESLGWRIHRVWSPAWVRRRDLEIEKLQGVLQEVGRQPGPPVGEPAEDPEVSNREPASTPPQTILDLRENGDAVGPAWAEPYLPCRVSTRASRHYDFHDPACREEHANSIAQIVAAEGPVHIDVVARRLAGAWGLQRVGSRMQDAVETAARIVVRKGSAKRMGEFLWPVAEGFELKARGPVDGDPSSERKLEYIAPEEIALAMQRVCRDGGGIERDALLTETARVFGVQRTGRVVLEVLEAALAKAVKRGGIIERESRLIAP